jgi:uncharacterized SAM-binding protein YcdF (DUF218 family)
MSVFLLFLIATVAFVLALRRRRRSAQVVFVLGGILFFAVGCGPLPGALLRDLQTDFAADPVQAWQPRTAIIVLGGGAQPVAQTGAVEVPLTSYGRVLKGLEIYLQCKRIAKMCVIITSGGDPVRTGVSEARVYADELLKAGVDPADLVLEGRSLNTWQNAQFCAEWLERHPQDQVVLVTSGFHLRRSVLYFSHFGVHAQAVRADYVGAQLSPLPQASNFLALDLALHEYAGLWRYRIYNLLGWNVEARNPRAI